MKYSHAYAYKIRYNYGPWSCTYASLYYPIVFPSNDFISKTRNSVHKHERTVWRRVSKQSIRALRILWPRTSRTFPRTINLKRACRSSSTKSATVKPVEKRQWVYHRENRIASGQFCLVQDFNGRTDEEFRPFPKFHSQWKF